MTQPEPRAVTTRAEIVRLLHQAKQRGIHADQMSLPRARRGVAERRGPDFSLLFFSAVASSASEHGAYRLVQEAARFADREGFQAIWLPERHFHAFGGLYPSPAVLAASVATCTRRIRVRAGSVIISLDHPLRVAEAWSMVDNLSGGRVDIAFGTGWNPNDFVLSPDSFLRTKEVAEERIAQVRALWRGEALRLPNGRGEPTEVSVFPRPVQPELPVWLSTTGNPDTFRKAGAAGFNILTMLLGSTLDSLADKVRLYRQARAEAGLDPAGGVVSLMLHTFVDPDPKRVRALVEAPFLSYIRSSIDVQRQGNEEGRALDAGQQEQLARYSFERYAREASLFGSPETCGEMLERVRAAGVDEIACLIDFGLPVDVVLAGLPHLAALRQAWAPLAPAALRAPAPSVEVTGASGDAPEAVPAPEPAASPVPIAVIGMSGSFAGAPDLAAFWEGLVAPSDLLGPPPPGRWPDAGGSLPGRGGFLADVEGFEPLLFGIAPVEAAAMDPHHRLLVQAARDALENAGYAPAELAGRRVGVFASFYSTSYQERLRSEQAALSALAVTGSVHSLAANRISYVFDWTGPSEVVDTACSSGLVAIHRALRALRDGECELALACGVSLLLSEAESRGLKELGVLSPTGRCLSFDRHAEGQVRGEGVGALLLKPLDPAVRDGDVIHGLLRGGAVNHAGGRSGSLTMPSARRQADCILAAWGDAGIDPATLGYIEGHGSGSPGGDLAELCALRSAFAEAAGPRAAEARCALGTVKARIGSLDAAGGLAGLTAALLYVQRGVRPGLAHQPEPPEEIDLAAGPLYFPSSAEPWPRPVDAEGRSLPRRAAVHAYGLGGTNAHLVIEEHLSAEEPAQADGVVLVPLSARDPDALASARARLRCFLVARDHAPGDLPAHLRARLADLAWTLQRGREALPCRWCAVVRDLDELVGLLEQPGAGPHLGPGVGPADQPLIALGQAWLAGGSGVWPSPPSRPRRVPLPGYPPPTRKFPLPPLRPPASSTPPATASPTETPMSAQSFTPPSSAASTTSSSSPQTRASLVRLAREELARTLQVTVDEIRPDTPFAELGVSSLTGVGFMDVLDRRFDLRLGVEVLYAYPSITALTDHLLREHGDAVARVLTPAPEPQPAAPPSSPVAAFYDYATSERCFSFDETYITLAPFPEIVPGFSWTRTFRDPGRYREHHDLMLRRQREMRAVFFSQVNFAKVSRFMDFGCGMSTDLVMLARQHPHLHGVGYTISPEQARAGQSRIREQGLEARLQVHCRDSGEQPFPGPFQLVFGVEVAHHVPNKEGLFGNISRSLEADGTLLLVDCLSNTRAPIRLPQVGSYTNTKEDYVDYFSRYGLGVVDCVDVSQEIANFMHDPHVDEWLDEERENARRTGRAERVPLIETFIRSWDNFGRALRSRLISYVLLTARRDPHSGAAALQRQNRSGLGLI